MLPKWLRRSSFLLSIEDASKRTCEQSMEGRPFFGSAFLFYESRCGLTHYTSDFESPASLPRVRSQRGDYRRLRDTGNRKLLAALTQRIPNEKLISPRGQIRRSENLHDDLGRRTAWSCVPVPRKGWSSVFATVYARAKGRFNPMTVIFVGTPAAIWVGCIDVIDGGPVKPDVLVPLTRARLPVLFAPFFDRERILFFGSDFLHNLTSINDFPSDSAEPREPLNVSVAFPRFSAITLRKRHQGETLFRHQGVTKLSGSANVWSGP